MRTAEFDQEQLAPRNQMLKRHDGRSWFPLTEESQPNEPVRFSISQTCAARGGLVLPQPLTPSERLRSSCFIA
jgi:hypothetical protein